MVESNVWVIIHHLRIVYGTYLYHVSFFLIFERRAHDGQLACRLSIPCMGYDACECSKLSWLNLTDRLHIIYKRAWQTYNIKRNVAIIDRRNVFKVTFM